MFDSDKFLEEFRSEGYSILHGVLSAEYIDRAKKELEAALRSEEAYHKGKNYPDYGMVLLCSLYGGAFLDLFDNQALMAPINAVLGQGSIVYAYTSSSMPPKGTNYSRRIHVDCPRVIPGYVTNVGATILLDDFTEENGATYFLPRSQERLDSPTEQEFYAGARRLVAPAGSVWVFNARVWHAGGDNQTARWRHALTLNMCRPYMKQRIDIPRAMEKTDLSGVSDVVRQKLGFLAQVPASLDEYYAPLEQRKYKQKVE